jgi:hypothetical protein
MRKRLMAAAAIAPLSFLAFQSAYAQTDTINNSPTGPISTATAVNGGPADITVGSGGTININAAGTNSAYTPGLILNSNNNIINTGTIQSNNSIQNVTGIQVQSGATYAGSIDNESSINLSEGFTPSDNKNSDGIAEAPFAQGNNRIGIDVEGGLTGATASTAGVAILNNGSINIQANGTTLLPRDDGGVLAFLPTATTAGILINGPVGGSILSTGAITMAGDNNVGFQITPAGSVNGFVRISGAISTKGQNSVALASEGNISGSLSIYSAIQSTGYASTTRVTGTQALTNIENTPTDVQQGGSGVLIQGSVQGGVFLGAPPVNTVATDTVTDADGDGIVDSSEGTGTITTYGSSPAFQIGGAPVAINLGNFNGGGLSQNAFGLIIEGTVSAQGVYDGISSTGLQIGGGGGTVNLNGGINVIGGINAFSYSMVATTTQTNAIAVHLESGTNGVAFQNSGTISSTLFSNNTNDNAIALKLDAGANISSLINYGTMSALVTGNTSNAIVVQDNSGSISKVVNQGTIATSFTAGTPGEPISPTVSNIALDLHNNTTGVTLIQSLNSTSSVAPVIVGDVLLSKTAPNTVQIDSGSVNGTLDLGSSTSIGGSLEMSGDSFYTGKLLYSGAGLTSITLNGASLQDNSPTTVNTGSLSVSGNSTLIVALDPKLSQGGGSSTHFEVSGNATFASGAKIGATLLSEPTGGSETFTIVHAASLNVGSVSTLLNTLPYLFNGTITADIPAGDLNLTVSTKTPAQLQLNKAETAAFPAIYAALPQDQGIEAAVLSADTRKNFLKTYDQLLPDSSGDVFETALNFSKAVSRTTAERFDLSTEHLDDEAPTRTGFWATEFYSGLDQQRQDNNEYHSAGLGVIGGFDFGGTGFTVSAASSNVTVPHTTADDVNSVSVVEGGAYAAPRWGPISLDARVGAGYLKVSDHRQFVATEPTGDTSTSTMITRTAEGDWTGYDLTAHIGAGFEMDVNRGLFFQPRVYADVFHLHEGAYNERNIGPATDPTALLLDVQQRDSTQTNATASIVTGMRIGSSFVFSPQLELGYDDIVTGGPGDTTAHYAYGGPEFTLPANQLGGAAMARITLRGDGNFVHFAVQAGGEYNSSFRSVDMKAVFRMTF